MALSAYFNADFTPAKRADAVDSKPLVSLTFASPQAAAQKAEVVTSEAPNANEAGVCFFQADIVPQATETESVAQAPKSLEASNAPEASPTAADDESLAPASSAAETTSPKALETDPTLMTIKELSAAEEKDIWGASKDLHTTEDGRKAVEDAPASSEAKSAETTTAEDTPDVPEASKDEFTAPDSAISKSAQSFEVYGIPNATEAGPQAAEGDSPASAFSEAETTSPQVLEADPTLVAINELSAAGEKENLVTNKSPNVPEASPPTANDEFPAPAFSEAETEASEADPTPLVVIPPEHLSRICTNGFLSDAKTHCCPRSPNLLIRPVVIDGVGLQYACNPRFRLLDIEMKKERLTWNGRHKNIVALDFPLLIKALMFFVLRGHRTVIWLPKRYNPHEVKMEFLLHPKGAEVVESVFLYPKEIDALKKLDLVKFYNGEDFKEMVDVVDATDALFVSKMGHWKADFHYTDLLLQKFRDATKESGVDFEKILPRILQPCYSPYDQYFSALSNSNTDEKRPKRTEFCVEGNPGFDVLMRHQLKIEDQVKQMACCHNIAEKIKCWLTYVEKTGFEGLLKYYYGSHIPQQLYKL
ncbi:hypothetical protein L596_012740 [Steinernema carpocapsae]|uniref:Zc3h12a-like Ribonuclease NYN domain-containing protein n=1 Tax=Steinernema carpocapsae TaxID=34508 RepID=A0A4U5NYB3_STECR|nr:hypothetical protein L596_012740 [Steinernema carpocapsae]